MSVKNSGSHLVIEVSTEIIGAFLHRFFTSPGQMGAACELWPLSQRVFELEEHEDGGAVIATDLDDGLRWRYFYGSTVKEIVMAAINLEVQTAINNGECSLPEDENNPGNTRPMRFQEKLDCFLRDILPKHESGGGTIRTGPKTIEELGILPAGVTILDFEVNMIGGGTGLALGIFFDGSTLSGQNQERFSSEFSTDFLNGQDIAISASVELLDQFVLAHQAVQDMLRNTSPLTPQTYTPHDPGSIATLTGRASDKLGIEGSGEFDAGNCDVDASWWVDVGASVDGNGALSLRAEFDYDASDWDQFICITGHILLGSGIGAAVGLSVVGAITGLITLLKGVGIPGTGGIGSTNVTSCGDRCSVITITNPSRQDGKFVFTIGDDSVELTDIDIVPTDVTLFGDATVVSPPPSELEIRDHNRWIITGTEFACNGTGNKYTAAGFTLHNPHSPSQAEFLGYGWPVICSIEFPDKVPGHAALSDFAEIVLAGPNAPNGYPFRVHGIHQQRVEVRVKPGKTASTMSSSIIVKTNTPPFRRLVQVIVDTGIGQGPIEVTPNPLEFEQRNDELLDLGGLERRANCGESGPPISRPVTVGGNFKIRNAGGGTIHVCDIILNDPNGAFEIRGSTSFPLLPFAAKNIAVQLNSNAQVNQNYTATISVLSTDAQNPQVDVTVNAVALDPPQSKNVDGIPILVDNYWNHLCAELARRSLGDPPIDVERWIETFTDPPPHRRDPLIIYDLAFKGVKSQFEVEIEGRDGRKVRGLPGTGPADLHLQLTEKQVGKMFLGGIEEGGAGRLQLRSMRMYAVGKYHANSAIKDMYASGNLIGLATDKGLQIVSVKNQKNPELIKTEPAIKLNRVAGSRKGICGISERGIEFFTSDWKQVGIYELDGSHDFALQPESGRVYALTPKEVTVLDFSNNLPKKVGSIQLEEPGAGILAAGSWLAVQQTNKLTVFDISVSQPKKVSGMDVSNVNGMSAWQGLIRLRTQGGTEMFIADNEGKLSKVASYTNGHWADSFVMGRHLLSAEKNALILWRMERRNARFVPKRESSLQGR